MSDLEQKSFISGVKIEIPESRYRADLDLLDRYINFSSEIVRLSLSVMAGLGIILGYLFKDGQYKKPNLEWMFNGSLTLSFFCLTVALALALMHRYYASDGFYHHIRAIKHLIRLESVENVRHDLILYANRQIEQDERYRNRKFDRSGRFLGLSSIFLFLGVMVAGANIATLLIGGTDTAAECETTTPKMTSHGN